MIKEKYYEFNPNIKKIISYNIRRYRLEKNMTQEALALAAEISYDFMRRIETNPKAGFSIQTLYKISIVLGVTVDDLMQDTSTVLFKFQ
ncbi:MAG: helix-turn-helix transcriptional regulator [Bacilli bacterium]